MLRKLKWQIPGEPLAARYNWCQGPAVEKHWIRPKLALIDAEDVTKIFRNFETVIIQVNLNLQQFRCVTGIRPPGPRFGLRLRHMGFVADGVSLKQGFLQIILFYPVNITPPMLISIYSCTSDSVLSQQLTASLNNSSNTARRNTNLWNFHDVGWNVLKYIGTVSKSKACLMRHEYFVEIYKIASSNEEFASIVTFNAEFDVFLAVHNTIDLFQVTNLM